MLDAVRCCGLKLLATRPSTKLEDTPCRMSVFLFSILLGTLHTWKPFPPPQPKVAPHRNDMDALNAPDDTHQLSSYLSSSSSILSNSNSITQNIHSLTLS
jgi:hypothetical protein